MHMSQALSPQIHISPKYITSNFGSLSPSKRPSHPQRGKSQHIRLSQINLILPGESAINVLASTTHQSRDKRSSLVNMVSRTLGKVKSLESDPLGLVSDTAFTSLPPVQAKAAEIKFFKSIGTRAGTSKQANSIKDAAVRTPEHPSVRDTMECVTKLLSNRFIGSSSNPNNIKLLGELSGAIQKIDKHFAHHTKVQEGVLNLVEHNQNEVDRDSKARVKKLIQYYEGIETNPKEKMKALSGQAAVVRRRYSERDTEDDPLDDIGNPVFRRF
jgi:hypothetical protein